MSAAAADGIDDRDIPKQELLEAAFSGDIDKIDTLMREKRVHIDSVDDDHVTALHIAAAMGNNKLMRARFALQHETILEVEYEQSSLHYAKTSLEGRETVVGNTATATLAPDNTVVRLLDHGANIHAVNQLGMTAYHYAAREGKLSVIDTLLQRGASKHQKTSLGVTALTLACAGGHADVVRRLIRFSTETPRHEASKRNLAPTPLIVATCSKSPQICSYLADSRVNLDETMDQLKGLSALSVAIICTPGVYMIRTLLDLGASATKRGLARLSPEELAKEVKRLDVLSFFNEKRSHRSRVNAESDLRKEIKKNQIIERELGPPAQNGVTLLMYATIVRSINSAKHLVLHLDSDVNMRDNMHITALQIASLLRVDDVITLLLQRRADATVVNKFGSTAYDLFLMSCDTVEPGHLRALLHSHRPADMKLNLSNSSSNLVKTFGTINLKSIVSSPFITSSLKSEMIEPRQWLEAKTRYQPAKLRNTYKFASVEDILKCVRIAKRPETNEYDNETEAVREYIEECQSFAVTCFTDFYGEREKTSTSDYYDIAQYHARRSAYPRIDGLLKKGNIMRHEDAPRPARQRKDSIEREYRKSRNYSMMDSPSQNQMRTTPRMIKKSRETSATEYYSAHAGRARASAGIQVPTVVVTRPRQVASPEIEEMIWKYFVSRGKIELMRALKAEEIDRHSFFMLKKDHLEDLKIYSPENLRVIEEIQQAVLSRSL